MPQIVFYPCYSSISFCQQLVSKRARSTVPQVAAGFFPRSGGCFLALAVFTLCGIFGILDSSSFSLSSSSRVKPCHRVPSPVPSLHDQIGRERLFVDLMLRLCTLSQPPRTAATIAGSAVSRFARTWAGDWERVPNLTELCQTDSIGQSLTRIINEYTVRGARAGPAVLVHVSGRNGAL